MGGHDKTVKQIEINSDGSESITGMSHILWRHIDE